MSPDTPTTPPESDGYRPLHPLPRGLVELYGFLAVLVVLIPEWMASGALQGFLGPATGATLPAQTRAWRRLPELRLASMSLAELRLLAQQLGLVGYAALARDRLVARLLKLIRRRNRQEQRLQSMTRTQLRWRRLSLAVAVVLQLLCLALVLVGLALLL
ncbi:MAG: Rho termination factor N-terminal domain-containing protein [Cyanobacteriota bacterium]|nr:Rho termination factor N-terminal domain-containing protein [Cyanobacteriota bacterium]